MSTQTLEHFYYANKAPSQKKMKWWVWVIFAAILTLLVAIILIVFIRLGKNAFRTG
jgi:hypothetical protein